MENENAVMAVAFKMIETFGGEAAKRLQVIVADHREAGDSEGVEFWGGVARIVERLQSAIEVNEAVNF